MTGSLWLRHIFPFTFLAGLLAAAAMAGNSLLHSYDLVWAGRYLGIPGTLLIIVSLVYSLRKRKYFAAGSPKSWLAMHEITAWLGSLMVLIHSGIHFNAILPWLATAAMAINVISGMAGKVLLNRAREHVQGRRQTYEERGMGRVQAERAVFWDAVMLDAMAQWRRVHIPIFIAFVVLALGHIVSIFLFWGWR